MNLRHTLATVVVMFLATQSLVAQRTPDALLQSALYKQQIEGDLRGAARILQQIVDDYGQDRPFAARALLHLGRIRETLGSDEAAEAYRHVLSDYPEQEEAVTEARARLAVLDPELPESEPGGLVARHLLSHPNAGFSPGAVSPDGRHVVFTDWADIEGVLPVGTGALVSRDATTGESIVLARAGADAAEEKDEVYVTGSIWSADGRRVAYTIWDESWDHQRLHIVDAGGANDRVISNNMQHKEIQPGDWSANSNSIFAFITGWDDRQRIAVFSVDDGSVSILKTLQGQQGPWGRSLSLSPDGRYVVYAWPDEDGVNDLFVLAVDGSRETRLAAHPANDRWPFWTPDGRRIVFLSERSGRTDIWSIEMDGGQAAGEPVLIRPGVGPQVRPLGFVDDGALMYQQSIAQSDVHVARMDWERATVTEARRLSDRFVGTNQRPQWSPDGERIAFLSHRDVAARERSYLVIRSLRDGSERDVDLTDPVGTNLDAYPAWSGDGKSVLLIGGGQVTGRRAYRVDAETGRIEREQYMLDDAGAFGPRYATGRQIAALRDMGIRIVGLRDHRYYRQGGEAMRPGERILWVRDGISWVNAWDCDAPPPAGAECLDVTPAKYTVTPVTHNGRNQGWELSPDGRAIALGLAPDMRSAPNAVWVWSIAGEDPPRELTSVGAGESIGPVRWSPDGKYLLVSVMDPEGDVEHGAPERIVRVRVLDGVETTVTLAEGQAPVPLGSVTFSPDGTQMVYSVQTYRDEVWTLSGFAWQGGSQQ